MRTTLDIDTDVLVAAKELARQQHRTAGEVVSDLLRDALSARASAVDSAVREKTSKYGIKPFPSRGGVVTNQLIDELRDELGD